MYKANYLVIKRTFLKSFLNEDPSRILLHCGTAFCCDSEQFHHIFTKHSQIDSTFHA